MSKKILLIYFSIILLFNIYISKCEETPEGENNNNDYDDGYSENYFKETLKNYLVERNLFESEEPVSKEQMKKIFLDVVTEGEYESSSEYFGGVFNELADYFVDSYFVNRKEIKGKEIYDLININHISDKFEQMLGNNPHFVNDENNTNNNDDEDEDNNEYDSRDDVGEPSPDV